MRGGLLCRKKLIYICSSTWSFCFSPTTSLTTFSYSLQPLEEIHDETFPFVSTRTRESFNAEFWRVVPPKRKRVDSSVLNDCYTLQSSFASSRYAELLKRNNNCKSDGNVSQCTFDFQAVFTKVLMSFLEKREESFCYSILIVFFIFLSDGR